MLTRRRCCCVAACTHTIRLIPDCGSTAVYTGSVTVSRTGYTQTVTGTGPDFVFTLPGAGAGFTISTPSGPTDHAALPPTVRTLSCGGTTTLTFPLDSLHTCSPRGDCFGTGTGRHIIGNTLSLVDSVYGPCTLTWNGGQYQGSRSALWPGYGTACPPTTITVEYTIDPFGVASFYLNQRSTGIPTTFGSSCSGLGPASGGGVLWRMGLCGGSGQITSGTDNPYFFRVDNFAVTTNLYGGPTPPAVTITVSE